jgi:arginyl-tRNA synthetase
MKQVIAGIIKEALKKSKVHISEDEIEKLIEIPPSTEMGDYAFPCFFLAGKMKQNPTEIALFLRKDIGNSDEFQDIQTAGAYINFFVDRKKLALNLIKDILSNENYGKLKNKNEEIMVEFSQPNTHKAFHVGHIRGTSLGESLSRILEFCGQKVVRANYSGDTGMHIAKWIWCYKKYHSREKLKNDESWIASIYVDAVKRLTKSKKLQEEVDVINQKIDSREDKKINELWNKTRKLSIDSWKKIYKELDTKFDIHYFESEVEQRGKEIAQELVKKKVAIISEGATIMDLKKNNLGVWVLLRKDGTVLYSAKDLALAERKFRDFPKLNKSITTLGDEQDLHFKQLRKTLELAKVDYANKVEHLPFGMVRLPTGKMSSRTGDNILYSDFIEEVTDHTKKEIKKRDSKISKTELEKRGLKVAIAGIKYSMLKQNPNKIIIFNKEEALKSEGDTGPYLLYSYARAKSILKKTKNSNSKLELKELDAKEIELVKKLSQFSETIENAYKNLNPSVIANYSYQLSQIFNEFYHECSVINSEKEKFRIMLVESFSKILKISLYILGIETLEEM